MKYVLAKPQGGINDMLCQIEACCRYAEKFNRKVLVDTGYENAIHFRDNLANYLVSKHSNLIINREHFPNDLNKLTTFPRVFEGNVQSIKFKFDEEKKVYVEPETRTPLTFDFDTDYKEELLVHQTGGGGFLSFHALRRFRLHDNITDKLIKYLIEIDGDFMGVHVRNTDYQTEYRAVINSINNSSYRGKVLVCTDDHNVLREFKSSLATNQIISYSNLEVKNDSRLHFVTEHDDTTQRNRDAFLDLLLLSFSSHLIVSKLKVNKEAPNSGISGFSRLAIMLKEDKKTLKDFIDREIGLLNLRLKKW